MFANLNLFQVSGQMATHATLRQRVIAENIANSNTPGYRQRDIAPFKDVIRTHTSSVSLQATRPDHRVGREDGRSGIRPRDVRTATQGPNGNTVSLEGEIMKTARVRQQHETALAVYHSTMKVIRAVIANR